MTNVRSEPIEFLAQPLLQTKITAPFCCNPLILRPRLDTWLHSTEPTKLVLVKAPAGFGKTTLLAHWSKQLKLRGEPTAWLTLDQADNDPGRFLTYLVAAVRKCIPSIDIATSKVDVSWGDAGPTGVILWLLEKLASLQHAFFLMLDDFDMIQNDEVLTMVQQIIHNLPPGIRVAIALRRVPELKLGKMRVQRELVEIDAEQLRFSLEESEQFLRQVDNHDLDDADIQYLQTSTEGWIAGLQLSTLSPAWRNIKFMQPYSGTFEKISGYLTDEIMSRQPEEIQTFLLQTCILNRLCGSLCDALTGQTNGSDTLDYLEQANLFLVPLDEERHWFRYHSLFARFLVNRLERKGASHKLRLHRLAAQWFEGEGDYLEAVHHALESRDMEFAASIMERGAMTQVMVGHFATVVEWGNRLPSWVLNPHPSFQLAYCFSLIYRQAREKVCEVLDEFDRYHLQSTEGTTSNNPLLQVRALLLFSQDKIADYEQLVPDGLMKYIDAEPADVGKLIVNMWLLNLAGQLKITESNFDEALSYIGRAAALMRITGDNPVGRITNISLRAYLELVQGRQHHALEMLDTAMSDPLIGEARYSESGLPAAIMGAEILYEMNQLEKAENLIRQFRSMLPASIQSDFMISGFRTLTRIHIARGDDNGAMHCLTELKRLGVERTFPRAVASAHLEEIRIALQQEDSKKALQIARDHDDKPIWQTFGSRCMMASDPETPEISRLRLLIGSGQPKKALEQLKPALRTAQDSKRVRQQILIQVLMAKAYEACGERRPALRALRDALLTGQAGGFVRSFLDEGEPIIKLLRELRKTASAGENATNSNISSEYIEQFFHVSEGPSVLKAEHKAEQDELPLDQLSDREIAVLEKVASGLSNEAIADQLFVSSSTVRFHLRNINSKLGANNRTQAVVLARQLGFIK